MPQVDEAAIRAAIEAGVRAALAELRAEPEDSWPDWDEYGGVDPQPAAPPVPFPSPLRARMQGVEEMEIEQGTVTGDVVPLGTGEARGAGFDPRGNPAWFERNYVRDVLIHTRG